MEKLRSYQTIVDTLDTLGDHIIHQPIGSVPSQSDESYTIYHMKTTNWEDDSLPAVWISGGVHGDEYSGPRSALTFFSQYTELYLQSYRFFGTPCINPWGYEYDVRYTEDGLDLNRNFTDEMAIPNVAAVNMMFDRDPVYDWAFDFHECGIMKNIEPGEVLPSAYHLFEYFDDKDARIGRHIVDTMRHDGFEVYDIDIHGEFNDHGVVTYPDALVNPKFAGFKSLGGYHYMRGSHSFTVEAYSGEAMPNKIRAHVLTATTGLARASMDRLADALLKL